VAILATFTCVLCLHEFPTEEQTDEHVFPEAIGGVIVLRDMCKPCNSRLGQTVDAALVNHVLMQMKRFRFGISGKRGSIPNPLAVGTVTDGPVRQVRFDPASNSLKVETQKSVEPLGPGNKHVTLVVDKSEEARIPEITKTIKERAERSGKTVGPFERKDEHVDHPTVRYEVKVDLDSWIGGLVKIIYELGCLELGPQYLADPWAERYRTLLKRERVTHDDVIAAGFFGNAWGPGRTAVPGQDKFDDSQIVGVLQEKNGKIGAYVRILNSFAASFVVSEDVQTFRVPPDGIAHMIDVEARTYRRFTDGSGWPR
jgi:hypothetical protein